MAPETSNIIVRLYGRKSMMASHFASKALGLLGSYCDFEGIDFSRVKRMIFICKENIGLSPYAEARARSIGILAASAGLEAKMGSSANPAAVSEAAKSGL